MDTLVTGGSACVLWKVITTSATPPILLSQLSLIIVTTRTQILRTADIRHGLGQSPRDQVTCDNWAVTGQRGGYSYPGDHPNPLPPVQSGSHNLLSSPGELYFSQAALAQPGLANEILIFSSAHICRRYLWFLS